MKIRELLEMASSGASSAASFATGIAGPNLQVKQSKKNKNKPAPNALDVKGVSLFGGSTIKR